MLHKLPNGIEPNPQSTKVSAEDAAVLVNCLIRDDGPRDLDLNWSSKVRGQSGNEWIEASAVWGTGHYYFWFRYTGGDVTNLVFLRTPKGSEYDLNDGGNPFEFVTPEDRVKLCHMLLGIDDPVNWGVELVPCWMVVTDGRVVFYRNFYRDKEEATAALVAAREARKKAVLACARKNLDAQRTLNEKPKPKKKK